MWESQIELLEGPAIAIYHGYMKQSLHTGVGSIVLACQKRCWESILFIPVFALGHTIALRARNKLQNTTEVTGMHTYGRMGTVLTSPSFISLESCQPKNRQVISEARNC